MITRIVTTFALLVSAYLAHTQCFLLPTEACVGECGPVFYLQSDPPGTTYQWSISCGTITNDTLANPHVVCFDSVGICTVQVIILMPGEDPDTCTSEINILPPSSFNVNEEVCEGDSVEINGIYYEEGTFTDTIFGASANGCDSILLITVTEIPNDTTLVEYSGCVGDSFQIIVNGVIYDETHPTGTEVLTGSNGCDSIVNINMIFLPHTTGEFIYFGCQGDSFSIVINTNIYNESNPTGVEIIPNANGCDSTINIMMSFFPHVYDTISYFGCSGDGFSITVEGSLYDESNPTGIDTLHGGCDTIVTIDLHFDTLNASLQLNGNQLCVTPSGLNYQWMNCDNTLLPDTTDCLTVSGAGCACIIVDNGICLDTICEDYIVCELFCNIIAPDGICVSDSFFVEVISDASSAANYSWAVLLDSVEVGTFDQFSGFWASFNGSGCYTLQLSIEENGCTTTCTHIICVADKPLADLCCTTTSCDSCFTLDFRLFGNPPWTLVISDGTTIDTVSGINSSIFKYDVCPPQNIPVLYTLLSVTDQGGLCEGAIINDTATVIRLPAPDATISVTGNTLCIDAQNFDIQWSDCLNTIILSTDRCFTPATSGCYCVEVRSPLTECIDTSCINFLMTGVSDPTSIDELILIYDKTMNTIDISGLSAFMDTDIQLSDLTGRIVHYKKQEALPGNTIRITLFEQAPSLMFVSVISPNFQVAKSIFIP